MVILGLEKLSLVDFEDKVCATIFTGGCNFLCPFCHNSGIVKKELEVLDTSAILDYLKKRKGVLDAVTVSGGEPTLQPDLIPFIKQLKEMGYLVKLDTNGTNPKVLKELLDQQLIDYVAMDIKNNFSDYAPIIGLKVFNAENVKKSLKLLHESGIKYELRTTLVKEFISLKNVEKMAEDLKGEKILYLQKFVDSEGCFNRNLSAVSKEEAEEYRKVLETTIEKVVLRGYN